jgi:predicted aldo/keto reductase-like oxidoreductase
MEKTECRLNRREFLQSGALAALAAGVASSALKAQEKKPDEAKRNRKKIRNYQKDMLYRRMGETDVWFSIISLGGGGLQETLAYRAIDRGVNLVHIAAGYNAGNSLDMLATVLKNRKDKIYVALKDGFSREAPDDIDPVLKRLGIDCVDFIMFNRHRAERVVDPAIRERFESWKAQGKVRWAGLTTHDDVKACLAAAADFGLYSVIQPALPQSGLEMASEELKKVHEKGIAVMPMKTMRDLKEPELQTAYLKKMLANEAVTTVNKGFNNFETFDAYLNAVKETLTAREDMMLYRHASQNRSTLCAMCGACTRACPRHIEVSSLLISKTYYHDQLGDDESALSFYRDLPKNRRHENNCTKCGLCEKACPNHVRIVQHLEETTRLFGKMMV